MIGLPTRERLGKAAIAKSNNISVSITGVYEADRIRFNSMSQDLGIAYDANNNVLSNTIKSDVSALKANTHTHSNKAALDGITAGTLTAISDNTTAISINATAISDNTTALILTNAKIVAIAALLGITFDVDGNITVEDYTSHTHNYEDSGVPEVTAGVN